ncbi:TonB-dependent receptor [Sphingomonas gei]|uniref:TonB-dependent receptor n=1 Tax=Sphingomonas gei TaxID=1395960 RepID=A0A4S1X924_9SPHN|nr:TonB-dependent receptor [Sphingomonas gei]TGX52734.1 TonB-dependent receptor [Sphingomonas gei]
MKKTNIARGLRGGTALSALVLAGALFAAPAFAQTEVPVSGPVEGQATDDAADTQGDIVVTGSRIPQANITSTAPVTVVGAEDIKLQGTTRVEDLLNSLPAVFASQSSALSNGADGTASVDLRGLGTSRTLTLINGRRLLPGDPSPTSGSAADINIIPASMLKRVEVLTGGASSTYGADAVAGVVNFIIDTDFEGFKIDGQYSVYQHNNRNKLTPGILDARQAEGRTGFEYPTSNVVDGGTIDTTVSFGTSFGGEDRGHATAYFGYRKVNAVTQSRRDYSACTIQNTGGGAPNCGGSLTSGNGTAILFDPTLNTASSTVYTFMPGGGFENTTTRFNFAPTNYFQRPDERYTAGAFINYDVDEAFKPYMEFMFMDDRTVAQIAPSGDFGNTLTVNCNNPLISGAQFDVICAPDNLINGFLGNFPLATAAPYNPNPGNAPLQFFNAFPDPITGLPTAYNRAFLQVLRRNTEGGPRQSDLQHTNYRGVIGTKGDLGEQWSYDAYYQFGRVKYSQVYSNEFSVARLTRALDVVSDPRAGSGGAPVCRSVVDGTDPNCVPYNIFAGPGGVSSAAVNYLSATGFQQGQTTEQVANISFTGQLGGYGLQTPWASDGVGINIGAEWRKTELELKTDNAFSTGDLTGQGGATLPIQGGFRVFEFFGETQIPLVQDNFIDLLSVNAGYRHSSYETTANRSYKTNTYKVGVDFAPIKDIRFRGTYNRAVRAPNIQELFSTATVGLNGSEDPCASLTDTSGNPRPVAATDYGCRAQGIAVGQGITGNPAGQYNGLIGGNQDLQPEKATTKTLGVVFQPSFVPRFALTVDYFDIKIEQAIRSYGQDAILQDCTDNATATFTPASCALVHRDAAGSLWLTPGGYVTDLPNNVGQLQTKGIEVGASYSMQLFGLGRLSLNMNGTYLDSYKVNNGLTTPYDCAGLYGPTCSIGGTTDAGSPLPEWRHKLRATLQMDGGVGLSVQWRHLGPVHAETTTDQESLAGDFNFDPGTRLKAFNYIDLTSSFSIGDSYTFRLGVNNLFDLEPPLVTSGNANRGGSNLCPTGPCNGNTYPGTYDALGRYLFAGVTLSF